MFDDLTEGAFKAEFFFECLKGMRPDVRLGDSIIEHAFGVCGGEMKTLRQILETAIALFKTLPKLSGPCEIEYRWQNMLGGSRGTAMEGVSPTSPPKDKSITGMVLGVVKEEYDSEWLAEQMDRGVRFWDGKLEELRGVEDIEDIASKCGACQFSEVCEWRQKKAEMVAGASVPPRSGLLSAGSAENGDVEDAVKETDVKESPLKKQNAVGGRPEDGKEITSA
ncbi:hypothetical protein HDU67_004595, partial [Dinochytrium kinnereticum]